MANLPDSLTEELVEVLAESEFVRIERIVSTGQASPKGFWYDQDEHEFVLLLKGEATLLFDDEGEPIRMSPGDFLNVPATSKAQGRVNFT